MQGETLYEPRALWSVVRRNTADFPPNAQSQLEVQFPREEFRNGGRYPITLTHLLVAPVGYTKIAAAGAPAPFGSYNACAAALQRARFFITSPSRQHYTMREPLEVFATPQKAGPAADPTMEYSSSPWASSLLGVYRWDFRRPMSMGLRSMARFDLGRFASVSDTVDRLRAGISFYEQGEGHDGPRGTVWNTNARQQERTVWSTPPTSPLGAEYLPADVDPALLPVTVLPTNVGNIGGAYPGPSAFDFADYRALAVGTAGFNALTGFSVYLDQRVYDDRLESNPPANVPPGGAAAPIGLQLPCRARASDGTQEWWWRPGAPLALVCPTTTPAFVHELPATITLQPGDALDVNMTFPSSLGQESSIWQVGVSFCGRAAIQG